MIREYQVNPVPRLKINGCRENTVSISEQPVNNCPPAAIQIIKIALDHRMGLYIFGSPYQWHSESSETASTPVCAANVAYPKPAPFGKPIIGKLACTAFMAATIFEGFNDPVIKLHRRQDRPTVKYLTTSSLVSLTN